MLSKMLNKQELATVRSDLRLFYLYSIEVSQQQTPSVEPIQTSSKLEAAIQATAHWFKQLFAAGSEAEPNVERFTDMFVAMDGCVFLATDTLVNCDESNA